MWQINKRVHHQPSGRSTGLVWSFGLNNPSKQAQPTSNQPQGDTWLKGIFEHPQQANHKFIVLPVLIEKSLASSFPTCTRTGKENNEHKRVSNFYSFVETWKRDYAGGNNDFDMFKKPTQKKKKKIKYPHFLGRREL
jgi:hypothetical protein